MSDRKFACPSSSPAAEDAKVFAVMAGSVEAPRASYLAKGVTLAKDDVQLPEGVEATRVFRFAGSCASKGCGQFADGACQLGKTVAKLLDDVADAMPACSIRGECRWFAENGPSICRKCPQVVTTVKPSDPQLREMLQQVPRGARANNTIGQAVAEGA